MELNQIFGILMGVGMFSIIIIIQFFLSRLKSNWPGLVLPIISFIFSLTFSLTLPSQMGWFPILSPLILAIFLGAIYVVLRRNRKLPTSSELRNMRAQDL